MQITFSADTAAALQGLVASFSNPGPTFEVLMAAVDTIHAKIQEVKDAIAGQKTEILAAVADEKTQVADAIAALEAKLGDVVTADQLANLTGELDTLKAASTGTDVADAVKGIFVPEPAPSPTPAAPQDMMQNPAPAA